MDDYMKEKEHLIINICNSPGSTLPHSPYWHSYIRYIYNKKSKYCRYENKKKVLL